ncbi:MAG: DnaD domain protein [Clostridia bacterium]|nr:DnaD domain protein [Clostridia bacterium]
MENKRIKIPSDGLVTIPKEAFADLKGRSAEELKTLIYFFSSPDSSVAEAANALGLTPAAVESACVYWREAGIFVDGEAQKKPAAKEGPYRNYDSDTLSKAIEEDHEFAMICSQAGEKLGKQLNKNDYSTLFYLYDFTGMPASVICGIIELCCANGKKSLQYIFKKTIGLYDEGIDTYDKFEAHLARKAAINSNIGQLRRLCGMGDRELTAKEQKMFGDWFGEWSMPFETVRLAYEKTVDGTGKLSFPYMNSILKRWYENGFTTVEDVANGESARKDPGTKSSFKEDEFIEAALKRGFDD